MLPFKNLQNNFPFSKLTPFTPGIVEKKYKNKNIIVTKNHLE